MGVAVMIAQFVLSLSILVVLHEFGHFLPAKWFKTKVEKFYLFFNPWFSLFKVKKGETEYGVGWLPLGGYVKIAGMIDESMDKEQMKQPPQPWEFRSKPAWQRLIIMLGGVTVNFLLGFVIFGFMLWVYGESYLPPQQAKYGIYVDSLGKELGLQEGDVVLGVGNKDLQKLSDREVIKEVVLNNARTIIVERNGRKVALDIPDAYAKVFSQPSFRNKLIFAPRIPFSISEFPKESNAKDAGLEVNDRIVGIAGKPTPYFQDFAKEISKYSGEEVPITFLRSEDTLTLPVLITENGKIGAYNYGPEHYLDYERKKYSLARAMPAGFYKGYRFLADQIQAFGQMFRGKIDPKDSLGGFGTIANLFSRTWDWESFWFVTAILSLILGFMNLLPIPALDGGHVVFLIWEVLTGRKPSDRFMEITTIIGFVIIIGLVVYANWLDILRFFG
jgi:regulator of sigma E protease